MTAMDTEKDLDFTVLEDLDFAIPCVCSEEPWPEGEPTCGEAAAWLAVRTCPCAIESFFSDTCRRRNLEALKGWESVQCPNCDAIFRPAETVLRWIPLNGGA